MRKDGMLEARCCTNTVVDFIYAASTHCHAGTAASMRQSVQSMNHYTAVKPSALHSDFPSHTLMPPFKNSQKRSHVRNGNLAANIFLGKVIMKRQYGLQQPPDSMVAGLWLQGSL